MDSCQTPGRSCQHFNFEPKNAAKKPVQLASTFSLFFSAGLFSAAPKTHKTLNVLNTLLERDISRRALFFLILTYLTACKAEIIHKMTTIFPQNGPRLSF